MHAQQIVACNYEGGDLEHKDFITQSARLLLHDVHHRNKPANEGASGKGFGGKRYMHSNAHSFLDNSSHCFVQIGTQFIWYQQQGVNHRCNQSM